MTVATDERRPFMVAEDGCTANGYPMDPRHAEEFCDKAIASLEKLRAIASSLKG